MIKLKDLISEGSKPKAGDYVRDKRTKELGKVNKIKGNKIAYVKFPSNKKSFLPMDVSRWKPSGNHNVGRTIWTEGLLNEIPLRARGVKQNIHDASDVMWQVWQDLKGGHKTGSGGDYDGAKKAKKIQDEIHKLHQYLRKEKLL